MTFTLGVGGGRSEPASAQPNCPAVGLARGSGDQGSRNAGRGDGACRGGHAEVGRMLRFCMCLESGASTISSQIGAGCDGNRGAGEDSEGLRGCQSKATQRLDRCLPRWGRPREGRSFPFSASHPPPPNPLSSLLRGRGRRVPLPFSSRQGKVGERDGGWGTPPSLGWDRASLWEETVSFSEGQSGRGRQSHWPETRPSPQWS